MGGGDECEEKLNRDEPKRKAKRETQSRAWYKES